MALDIRLFHMHALPRACERRFHTFFTRFVRNSEKQASLQPCLAFSVSLSGPSACRQWASSHVAAASHPWPVTLGSVLAGVSQRRTKCLAQRRANSPLQVRHSACVCACVLPPPRLHLSLKCVCVCGGEINVPRWCSQDVKSLLFFFPSSLSFEIQLPVQLGCRSIVNFWRLGGDQ